MSTRAQIAIQTGPEAWAHVYIHYDGYPGHMLPALASWTPEDILAAREIRQVRRDALDCFESPRKLTILPRPTRDLSHLYVWLGAKTRSMGRVSAVVKCGQTHRRDRPGRHQHQGSRCREKENAREVSTRGAILR